MKKFLVIAVTSVAVVSLAGCAGKGVGKGVGKGKGPVVMDTAPMAPAPTETFVTKG